MSRNIKPLVLGLLITFILNGLFAYVSTALSVGAEDLQTEQSERRSE